MYRRRVNPLARTFYRMYYNIKYHLYSLLYRRTQMGTRGLYEGYSGRRYFHEWEYFKYSNLKGKGGGYRKRFRHR